MWTTLLTAAGWGPSDREVKGRQGERFPHVTVAFAGRPRSVHCAQSPGWGSAWSRTRRKGEGGCCVDRDQLPSLLCLFARRVVCNHQFSY